MIKTVVRQIAVLLGLALFPAFISGAIQLKPRERVPVDEVTPAQLAAERPEIVWVDARTAEQFAAGHAEGAFLLTPEHWDELIPPFLDAWHPAKSVIVYDDKAGAGAAETVGRRLHDELQMKNVRVLKGGWHRWQKK